MMKDLKQFDDEQLKTVLKFTEFLVDRNSDINADFSAMKNDENELREVERRAKEFASRRNGKKPFARSLPEDIEKDTSFLQGLREWGERQYKKGHGKRR